MNESWCGYWCCYYCCVCGTASMQSFRWRSCWLNNSLLRPPHSGRHRCRLLGRGYPDVEWVHSHIPPSIIIASIHSTDDDEERSAQTMDCFARLMRSSWVQSQRRVDSNERDSVHRNRLDLYVLSGQRWTYRAIRRNWEKLAKIEYRFADEMVTGSMGSNKTTRTLLIYSWSRMHRFECMRHDDYLWAIRFPLSI